MLIIILFFDHAIIFMYMSFCSLYTLDAKTFIKAICILNYREDIFSKINIENA